MKKTNKKRKMSISKLIDVISNVVKFLGIVVTFIGLIIKTVSWLR